MMNKKVLGVFCILLAFVLIFSSCKLITTDSSIDSGMSHFVEGRTEVFPSVTPLDAELDELIGKYSGGFAPVEIKPNPNPTPKPPTPVPSGKENEIGNVDDLIRAFTDMVSVLDESSRTFTLLNGYTISTDDIMLALDLINKTVPLYSNYVDSVYHTFYSDADDCITFSFEYELPTDRIREEVDAAKAKAKEIEQQLNLSAMSNYEKVDAVNKYLCENAEYDEHQPYSIEDHSAYGALLDGVCVCDGYARSAWLLLSDVGVDIYVCVGIAGGPHAWNIVSVDGNWYQMDVCWNDGSYSIYDYFLVDDAFMRRHRTWDYDYYPASTSGTYPRP